MAEKRLKASIVIGGLLDGSLRSAFSDTKTAFYQLGATIKSAQANAKRLKDEIGLLEGAGKPIDAQTRRFDVLTGAIDRARRASEALVAADRRGTALRSMADRTGSLAAKAGVGSAILGLPMRSAIHEAKDNELERARIADMGFTPAEQSQAIQFGKSLHSFGVSQTQSAELMRDAMSVFRNLPDAQFALPTLAKLKFGNAAMFGQEKGEENTRQFMDTMRVIDSRGGASSREEFARQSDYLERVIAATGNRVTSKDWVELIQRGGVAAKSMSNDAFYYTMTPLVQDMGSGDAVGTGIAALYNNLYQGKTTKRSALNLDRLGLIGDPTKVKYDKAGQTAQLNPGAILGASLLRNNPFEWMQKVFLPTLAKHGITDQKQILDVIGSIVSNKTGANLLSTMLTNQKQIEREIEGMRQANGVEGNYSEAKETTSGKELGAQAEIANARLAFGNALLPTYKGLLDSATSALVKFNLFAEKNPKLVRDMGIGIGALTVGLAASVPILLTAGAAMNAYAGYTLLAAKRTAALEMANLKNAAAAEAEAAATTGAAAAEVALAGKRAVGGALSAAPLFRASGWRPLNAGMTGGVLAAGEAIGGVMGRIGSALRPMTMLGGLVRGVGLAFSLLVSPVGVAVGAIAVGAVLIWRNWERISTFFRGVGRGIMQGLGPVGPQIGALFKHITSAAKSVWNWFGKILEPVHLTKDQLEGATEAGVNFGKTVGSALSDLMSILGSVINGFGWIIEHAGGAISSAYHWATGDKPSQPDQGEAAKPPLLPRPGATLVANAPRPLLPQPGAALAANAPKPALTHPVERPPAKPLPKIPPLRSNTTNIKRQGDTVTHTHTYNITQQPGESSADLARRIAQMSRDAESRRGGELYDKADAH